jgi:putative tryptophan/tyrosine transport system substrate-binding protein
MIAKRSLVGAAILIGLGAPIVGRAQASAKVHRIGLLANGSAQPRMPAPVEALREALRDLGLVEGRTIEIEYRWAEGRAERLPELAADLVRAKVELIVAAGDAPTRAAMAATRAIPIVMATSGDAVGAGFVASLSRPGGNVTGMTAINPELGAKRLQLLHELRPKATSVAALRNPGDDSHALDLKATQAAASGLGLSLQAFDLRSIDEVDSVFGQIAISKPDALVVFNDTTTVEARPRIVQLAALHRIPAMYEAREWAAAGGLLAYGVTHVDLFRQSASHVDKILKGAKPADLPVEQPTRIRLTVNLKAARALDIAIPQSLLLRADEVIE